MPELAITSGGEVSLTNWIGISLTHSCARIYNRRVTENKVETFFGRI